MFGETNSKQFWSWLIVSKAFCKSVKIMSVIEPWSKPLGLLSFKNDR